MEAAERPLQAPPRLMCLDVYRGLAVAAMILVDNPGSDAGAYWPIKHAEWNGWTPADLIFPSFLFLVGVSLVFSFSSRLGRGESRAAILSHVFKRSLVLILVGLFVNAMPIVGLDLHSYRFYGVTQRIALCYLVASALELWTGRRAQVIALLTCVLGYWALLRFAPLPGFGVPGRDVPFMDADHNLVAWLDRRLFMGHLYNGTRDPEGLLSTIPAIGTTLLGVLAGHGLRSNTSVARKLGGLLTAGILGLAMGALWNHWFPINKNLWTSSFVLFSGGFALLMLGLLYWTLDVRKWQGKWTLPFLVLGTNAIAGFVADSLVYGPGYTFTAKGPTGLRLNWHETAQAYMESYGLSTANASLVYSIAAAVFCCCLLWVLWRKKIFIKV